ncbi:uncharacterized protein LOC110734531 [Chenopodium quinoa]|uniref:uncharacterized protein LOC110734531 n=1 Tax=Chenopodium quinoa TaxID=63459 RepID=UPI000B7821F5|nr:uncharacterized protein LOC110734531 [Chenopodium quinoa]
MVRPFPYPITDHFQSLPLSIGIFVSVFALVALCARHGTTRSPRSSNRYDNNNLYEEKGAKKTSNASTTISLKTPPRSPLANPKKLLSNISNIKTYNKNNDDCKEIDQKEGFGEGGLWQKEILMGEKCQPLEFSGVIYYDNYGTKISQPPPRSPRASVASSWQGSMSSFPASSRSSSDTNN